MTMINTEVQIHDGHRIGATICEKFITGEIVKVNEKSIRVHMTHKVCTRNGKPSYECKMNEIATFTFWKAVENREFGKNVGKNVSFYKNTAYGVIEIVNN